MISNFVIFSTAFLTESKCGYCFFLSLNFRNNRWNFENVSSMGSKKVRSKKYYLMICIWLHCTQSQCFFLESSLLSSLNVLGLDLQISQYVQFFFFYSVFRGRHTDKTTYAICCATFAITKEFFHTFTICSGRNAKFFHPAIT